MPRRPIQLPYADLGPEDGLKLSTAETRRFLLSSQPGRLTVVVGGPGGEGRLVSSDGKSLQAFPHHRHGAFGSPAIGTSSIVPAGSDDDRLFALDPRGREG